MLSHGRGAPASGIGAFLALAGGLAKCMTSGVHCRAELLFLASDHFLAPLDPLFYGVLGFLPAFPDEITAFLRGVAEGVPRLSTGARRVEHTQKRPKTKSRDKPHQVVGIVFLRHSQTS